MSQVIKDMKNQIKIRSDIPHFLRDHCLFEKVCEVGVRYGYNLQQLAAMKPGMLIAVDHWRNDGVASEQDTDLDQGSLDKIHSNVFMRYLSEPNVHIFRGRSDTAARMFPLRFFDFVYLDADHSYEGALADMRLWWARIRQGGIMAGHDYVESTSRNGVEFGVIRAVEQFMKEMEIKKDNLHVTREGWCTWLLFNEEGE